MEDMEKLLQNMTSMKDEMEKLQAELPNHREHYEKDGIKLDVHGDGVISNLNFPAGTPPSAIEKAINEANAKMKDFITKKMNDITPAELRERAK
jgi:DNA-binding protein YbaB